MSVASLVDSLALRVATEFKKVRVEMSNLGGQSTFMRQTVVSVSVPVPGSTTVHAMGHTLTLTGTATSAADPVETGTSAQAQVSRTEFLVTTAATTAVAGIRTGRIATRARGFRFLTKAGVATGAEVANHRFSVGLVNSTSAPTDVNPSTITQQITVGYDSTDANLQVMHCGPTGPATKVDLGSAFPVPTVSRTDLWRVEIYAADQGTSVEVTVTNLATRAKATRTLITNLPTVPLAIKGYASVGGTSSVVGYTHAGFQLWSAEV